MYRYIGSITADVSEARWKSLVNDHSELTPTDAIDYINPFTQESDTMTYTGEMADVTIDGSKIGALRWFRFDGQEIGVFGNGEDMQKFARGLAKQLKGSFEVQ